MKSLQTVALLFIGLIVSAVADATVHECNDSPCYVKKVVMRTTISCPDYHSETTFTCGHYLNYGDCLGAFVDGYDSGCYFTYVVESITWIPVCGYVVAITGLPPVVCVNEDYTVTAVSNGPPLSQGVVWGGDAAVLCQIGNTAVVRFANSGAARVLFAAANGQTQPVASVLTHAVTVSYSPVLPPGMAAAGGIQFPPRGGPPSVPFNGVAEVSVTFSPNIGSTPLRFKSSTRAVRMVAPSSMGPRN